MHAHGRAQRPQSSATMQSVGSRPSSLRYTLLRVFQAGSEFLNTLGQASKELEASRGSSQHTGSFGDAVASAVQRARQVYAQKLTTNILMVRRLSRRFLAVLPDSSTLKARREQ